MGYMHYTPQNEANHLHVDFLGHDSKKRPILTDGTTYYAEIDNRLWARQGDAFSEPLAPLDLTIGYSIHTCR